MQSTCGLSIAARIRSVGSLSNAVCSDATTQSSPARMSSSTSSVPSARMLTSMPCSSGNVFRRALTSSISLRCASSRPPRR